MNWYPLCNYTHYSLLKGFSKPDELAKKCKENEYKACGIADYKSLSGAVAFYQACIENDIRPIIGCSFDGFSLFAKNKRGWFDLIEIVSSINPDGVVNSQVLLDSCSRNNLISIAKDESLSPIKGEDFYVKKPCLLDIYYTKKSDAPLHRILLTSGMKTTTPKINASLKSGQSVENQQFFETSDFYLKDSVEMSEIIISEDSGLENLYAIYDKCENYNILSKPNLPKFKTKNGETEEEYLKELLRDGWRKLLIPSGKVDTENKKQIYLDRFNKEFASIKKANLFGYFLIVQDIIRHVHECGWMSGPGRGSSSGCLISYLIGITQVDPIEFDLLFERFYNDGRNTEERVSLPDIDIDVPTATREPIIRYLKDKYGHNNVCQMTTFGRLQGKSALKEVLRVGGECGFGEMNEMTKGLPNEAEISDQLQEMDEEERSIIRWSLINNPSDFRDYCIIKDNGELAGNYADYFAQAIGIEGTFKSQGKHAAGIVISSDELFRVCPMVNPKTGEEKIAGLEMSDLEAIGQVKFDLLGISLLDKIMKIKEMVL